MPAAPSSLRRVSHALAWRRPTAVGNREMRVLFVAAELYPLIKTGGLADVAAVLPAALAMQGVDGRIALPGYAEALDRAVGRRRPIPLGPVVGRDDVALIAQLLDGRIGLAVAKAAFARKVREGLGAVWGYDADEIDAPDLFEGFCLESGDEACADEA